MQKETIRLSKPIIGIEEKNAVLDVLSTERLGMGDVVEKFENQLGKLLKREATCCVNGTSGLHLALQACGIGVGDEVLVQSLTYVASFQAISACGATPIPCDVKAESLTLDIEDVKRKLNPKSKAIMPVHFAGDVGELDAVYELAKSNSLRVIEDAAHAFGSSYNNKRVGSFGDICCFSFDGIKNITSGEGGCVVSNDKNVISLIKNARLLGIKNDTEKRFGNTRSWHFDVSNQGWRYHMSDIMAAIGIEQLKKLDYFIKRRRKLARLYDAIFLQNDKVTAFNRNYHEVVPHIYSILLPNETNRDQLRNKLLDVGIETGVHYMPNHKLNLYKTNEISSLKNTEEVYPRLISLPLHPGLEEYHIEYITSEVNKLLG